MAEVKWTEEGSGAEGLGGGGGKERGMVSSVCLQRDGNQKATI